MRPGWYILNYHDVSWESSPFVRGMGGTVSPDIFRVHLRTLGGLGDLISVRDGFERCAGGRAFERPTFSLWFDDGFSGVRRYALPLLRELGVSAAASMCSRFALRQEMFWRAILSYLHGVDALRILRTRLKSLGYDPALSLREWTLEHFSTQVVEIINRVYEEYSSPELRRDAFRIFEDVDGLRALAAEGWVIANHTAAHYPSLPEQGPDFVRAQFDECERLVQEIQPGTSFWVIPFEKAGASDWPVREFYRGFGDGHPLVRVGERGNSPESLRQSGVIYRLNVAWHRGSPSPFAERPRLASVEAGGLA